MPLADFDTLRRTFHWRVPDRVDMATLCVDDRPASDPALIVVDGAPARTRLAAHEVPRRVHFVEDLPRTATGRIMRRALRR